MRVLSMGEAMIELSSAGPGLWRQAVGGDSFNTAALLAALRPDWRVDYATRLGHDPMSEAVAAAIVEAGVGISRITRDPQRSAGLYMISLKDGERSFSYWRETSAARLMAEDAEWLRESFDGADLVFLSGITLAILAPEARARLLTALKGRRVAFDPNIRPRLWESPEAMRATIAAAAALSEILLPSFDDEAAAFGDSDPLATARRYAAAGVAEVVVKNGAGSPALLVRGEALAAPAPRPVAPVDTTGAGDAFNAGYLAARLDGAAPLEALALGQNLAALVVRHPGAVPPRAEVARFAEPRGLGARLLPSRSSGA